MIATLVGVRGGDAIQWCEATAEIETSLATKEIEKELINRPDASATLSNSASSR